MKYIIDYKTFESVNGNKPYAEGDIVIIRYEVTKGDPILTPVKITKVFQEAKGKYNVTHKIEDSNLKNFPDLIISHKQIIDYYKALGKPMDNVQTTQNPRINPNVAGFVPGANGQPVNDITQLAGNQSPSNDIAI